MKHDLRAVLGGADDETIAAMFEASRKMCEEIEAKYGQSVSYIVSELANLLNLCRILQDQPVLRDQVKEAIVGISLGAIELSKVDEKAFHDLVVQLSEIRLCRKIPPKGLN